MILDIRISVDSSQKQRYTEEEIKNEIKNENVNIKLTEGQKTPLLIRKNDGAILGEILL